jgi:prepilin-type N-terminal cleavage/methylation domain-containing protein
MNKTPTFFSNLAFRAFTLIELLIVVAIISILALIAVPNFQEAVKRSDRAACASNLKALASALAMYKVDCNHFPLADGVAGPEPSPGRTEIGNGPAAGGSWDGAPRILVTLRYLSGDQALFCPALRKKYRGYVQNFRYAYNSSASDTFGHMGGADHIDQANGDFWIARCVWVPPEKSFHPDWAYVYPHGDEQITRDTVDHNCLENILFSDMRVNLRNGRKDFYEDYGLVYSPR